ncbi:MAG TPA: 1,2-phenylacetyl-CoA epoxidase subunit PaaD [Candidatus Limnocylindrales bacterium]|nr:1,2-phenylacetyl-CoA epoxidase subunit PaaD [Candidatus Limnocylindrales bacterium]
MVIETRAPDEAAIRAALADVTDPEIPAISIVDLGIVHRIEAGPIGPIRVELLPTFVGCPAIAIIQSAVAERLATFGRPVEVEVSFAVPWTSERISPAGQEALRRSGFAPPAEPAAVRCPYCDSARVAMDSAFGPTLCRALYYCRECRQPFEAFKAV